MKNVKKMLVPLFIILLTCLMSIGALIVVANDSPVWSDVSIQDEYVFNSVLEIPSRTLTIGKDKYDASFVVNLPDGSTSVEPKLTLNQGGVYTIRYYVNGDAYYSKEEQFVVYDYLYSFETTKSSAQYKDGTGLAVSLADGDVLHFNSVIDLNDISGKDTLFSMVATPKKDGQYDFSRVYFTFTDVSDPSNYMTVSLRRSVSSGATAYLYTYIMAGGENQILTGLEGAAAPYKIHVEGTSSYGRPVQHSFSHNTLNTDHAGRPIDPIPNIPASVVYDNSTKELFASNLLIADLDNPDYFSSLWSGFESGKVRLSVHCSLYEGTTADFVIKSVYGIDLSSGKINDSQGPDITLNTKYADAMPDAEKGLKYSVPTATAWDANTGVADVQTMVWFNYNTSAKSMVTVNNGEFYVDRVGTYAIEYIACDKYGNSTTEVLYVLAREDVAQPEIAIDDTHTSEIKLGDKIIPADHTAAAYSGDVEVSVQVKLGESSFELTGGVFMPERAGDYTVEYTAKDYIGQIVKSSYTVKVVANPLPQFIDIPDFPLVLIGGSEQSIPKIYVNDYRSGELNRVLVAPTITDANGTKDVVNERITPSVAQNGDTVKLTYSYEGAIFEKEIPVATVWTVSSSGRPTIDLKNYLYSNDNSISAEKTESSIIVSPTVSDGSFIFANMLPSEKCELIFSSVANKCKYDAIKITFRDAEYNDIAFEAYLINNGNGSAGVKIGDTTSTVSLSFAQGSQFNILYSEKTLTVGVSSFDITSCINGESFEGFVSDKIYVELSFLGAGKNAAIALESVNGHAMTSLTSDRTVPKIIVCGEYGGSYALGSDITIPKCLIGDVLDPNVTAAITVTDPDGNVVTSKDGVLLKNADPYISHTFNASQYGQYKVIITASDTFNSRKNDTSLIFMANVRDDIKPEIVFSEEMKTEAKVGDILVLPVFTVSDNLSAAEELVTSKFVYTPEGRLILLEGDSNSIVASREGVYEFRISVRDSEGNLTFERIRVTVEKDGVNNE